MKPSHKKALKIVIAVVAAILSLLLLVVGGLNLLKFAIYSEYYSIKSDICVNPGLNDGFVCQGICAVEDEKVFLVSGYMIDGSNSRIYITDTKNNSRYIKLTRNGKAFDGHVGGVACNGNTVYIVDEEILFTVDLYTLLDAKSGSEVDLGQGTAVNNSGSFVYADEKYVYVGEFHDNGLYVTNHKYKTADGTYHAIVSRYSHEDLTKPDRIYSIRDKVQGICFTPDGQVVMSTSYGLADSVYYVYDEAEATDSELTLDGAPVYFLDNCKREIKGPALAEGIDYYDGKIITLTESASNKYIFGKLFYADKIVGLDLNK